MPDTGLPWEIPYLDGTELVRDYPAASEALADAVAAGLTAAGNAGIGSNVVSSVRTSQFSQSIAVGALSNDAITATITPSSATAKVLVVVNAGLSNSSEPATSEATSFAIFRNGSILSAVTGDADGSRTRVTSSASYGPRVANGTSFAFVDSPATAAAVTYSIRLSHSSSGTITVYLNRGSVFVNQTRTSVSASSIVLIEVKE
jgi:hypothetical protein